MLLPARIPGKVLAGNSLHPEGATYGADRLRMIVSQPTARKAGSGSGAFFLRRQHGAMLRPARWSVTGGKLGHLP